MYETNKKLIEDNADATRNLNRYNSLLKCLSGDSNNDKNNESREALCLLMKERYAKILSGIVKISEPQSVDLGNGALYYVFEVTESSDSKNFFKEKLSALSASTDLKLYVYSVEPKEYAQNISDVAAREKLKNFVAGIKASIPTQNVGLDAYGQFVNRSQHLLQSIKRKPLVVGFANGLEEFGWIIGPKFNISEKGTLEWETTPVQYSFQASVVVPAWMEKIFLKADYSWIDEKGYEEEKENIYSNVDVLLPGDPSAFTAYLARHTEQRRPFINPISDNDNDSKKYEIQEGNKSAQIIIRGRDLWRNPEVFVGSQKATSVEILPDMQGLVARFEYSGLLISPPLEGKQDSVVKDLIVFTSNGQASLKDAVLIKKVKKDEKKKEDKPTVKLNMPHGIEGRQVTLTANKGAIPDGFYSMKLVVRPKGRGRLKWAEMPVIKKFEFGTNMEKHITYDLKIDDRYWQRDMWGTGKANLEMEADLAIQASKNHEGEHLLLFTKNSTLPFVYFKSEKDSQPGLKGGGKLQWDYSDKNKKEKRFLNDITITLSNGGLFYLAYPELEKAFKDKFTIKMTAPDGKMTSLVVGEKIKAKIKEGDTRVAITIPTKGLKSSTENLDKGFKWLFERADSTTSEISMTLLYGKQRALLVTDTLKISNKK